ncbi:uncharacterized protein KD926_011412 [Aspergillus affinis]|uniref:uncharacterized protein n=1 Tax=Aspergillus affinis TaxID=1070780 RepID=UPI0022FE693B|nr:uncharacterized protein KD926_011412 [Aspergillus affinis]KAI9037980.1 hypothetical protein KD926_011412 [Aspergillus affinis]
MSPQSLAVPAAPPPADDDQLAISFWRKRYDKRPLSANSIIANLDIEYNELATTWKLFQDNLPPEDQIKFDHRAQTADDVSAVLQSVQNIWMSSSKQRLFTASMKYCQKFRDTLELHTVLLNALPKNEYYISLFYGALQSLIKASANYPRIVEGLMRTLSKMNKSIKPLGQDDTGQAGLSKDSILHIARFYSMAFFMLGEIMDWYVRNLKCRLLTSLNHDLYSDLSGLLSRINRRAKDIMRAMPDEMDLDEEDSYKTRKPPIQDFKLWETARFSQVGLQKQARRYAAQNAITRQLIWEIQNNAWERLGMMAEREKLLSNMLEKANQRMRPVNQQSSGIACLTITAAQDLGMQDGYLGIDRRSELTVPSLQDTSRFKWSQGFKHKYTRVELQVASKHLQDFFDCDDQVADLESDVDVIAEDSMTDSLHHWATNCHSQVLAVGGSPSAAFLSPVALISACIANFARQAKLPVISHFCSLPTKVRDGMTQCEQSLIALAYSLIRQLIDCLPPVLEGHAACNLSTDRFSPLNGTLTSWKEVLSLIDILLHYAPPLVVCVIDGLDKIQDASTDQHIRSLVRTLLTNTRHQTVQMPNGTESQSVLLKVLFTVVGRPSSLVETLSENRLILSESNTTDEVAAVDQALNPDVGVVMMNA